MKMRIEDDFILEQHIISENETSLNIDDKLDETYYKFINILINNKHENIIKGTQQLSGTCSFYSLYWLLYYLLDNQTLFDDIIDKIRVNLILKLKKELQDIDNKLLSTYLNILCILEKDTNEKNDIYKDKYRECLKIDYFGDYEIKNYKIIDKETDIYIKLKKLYDLIKEKLLEPNHHNLCYLYSDLLQIIYMYMKDERNDNYNIKIIQELILYKCFYSIFNHSKKK
jgi:hypothetical protein